MDFAAVTRRGVSISLAAATLMVAGAGWASSPYATLTFQHGVDNGYGVYTGTADTWYRWAAADADTNYGSDNQLWIDYDDGGGEALIIFNDIIGSGAGKVPHGATIHEALLRLYVTNPGTARNPLPMLQPWDAATLTFNNAMLGGNTSPGIQGDNIEAPPVPQGPGTFFEANPSAAFFDLNVTYIVQMWANGTSNYGFWLPTFNDDGLSVVSSDYVDPIYRPILSITFSPEPATLGLLTLGALAVCRRRETR